MVAVVFLRPPTGVIVIDAKADEGVAFGGDEPPTPAVMFGAEETGGFKVLFSPTAILVQFGFGSFFRGELSPDNPVAIAREAESFVNRRRCMNWLCVSNW